MARPIPPEHWDHWIAHTTDPRVLALRDTPDRFAEALSGTSVTDRFHFGQTLLHVAATFGRLGAIELLLDQAVDIEAQNQAHWTALMAAADYGQVEAVDYLIQRGARTEYLAVPRLTPEELEGKREDFRKLFEANPYLKSPPLDTALKDPSILEEMLDQMAEVIRAPHQERVIHHCHDLDTLKLLVGKYHCEINVHDGAGYWPLKAFAEAGNDVAIKYLLDAGADVHLTSTGDIALHTAVRHGTAECVRLLLEHGSNPNQQDVDGWTALHGVRDMESLEMLLKAGADPRIGDQVGLRASHWVKDERLNERLLAAEREWDSKR